MKHFSSFTGSLIHYVSGYTPLILPMLHAIHDLVARAMFLEAAVILVFISEISSSDTRGKL